MAKKIPKRNLLDHLIFFFPVQLLVQYFKSHQVLLIPWFLILLFVTNSTGRVMGIPYLFLDPEYLHRVSFWSFFMIGISFGALATAFHITGYILHAGKYKFIGLLKKPFSNFSINNSLIPFITLTTYLIALVIFQYQNEQSSGWQIFTYVFALLLGTSLALALLYGYFKFTNKDIYAFITKKLNTKLKLISLSRINILDRLSQKKKRKVTSFVDLSLGIKATKDLYQFPDKKSITKVFDQNHLNSVILVIIIFILFLLMGFGIDYQAFQLPAAATVLLLFALVTMTIGALAYWAKEWVVTTALVIYLVMDFLFIKGIILDYHEAFGLDYHGAKSSYAVPNLHSLSTDSITDHDKNEMIKILDRWRAKQSSSDPKAVFVCVSGGGSRSALWAFSSLVAIDQQLNHQLLDQNLLMTGASGGMVGASFFREMAYRQKLTPEDSINTTEHFNQISRDNLNPVIFNMLVNDLLLRNPTFEYEGNTYTKDRGFAFEQQLNFNTGFVMDKKLTDYGLLESQAEIPLIIFGPTIMNDGRKLYISAHHTAFMNTMTHSSIGVDEPIVDAVDFMRFFENQGANNLKYTSALRMNASFPYITPSISLPSDPAIKVMDAGVTDNFGLTDAVRFIFAFRDWLSENTSGLVIISIRDTKRVQAIEPQAYQSIFDKVANPISSVYNNLANFQDISNEYKLGYMREWYGEQIDHFVIEYDMYDDYRDQTAKLGLSKEDSAKAKRPSLNWHLTAKEKKSLIRNIQSESNQKTIRELVKTIKE